MSDPVIGLKLEGGAQLAENLRRLSSDVAAKWTNGGLRAGVKVIALSAQGRVPVKSGLLRKTIRISRGRKPRDGGLRDFFVRAGSRVVGGGGAFYAAFQELGTKPHVIKARDGGKLRFGGKYARVVRHPGNPATHYMETSLRNSAQPALTAMASYIRTKLQRGGMLNPATETE